MAIAFRTHHGTYLTAEQNSGDVVANPRGHDDPRAWQKFSIEPIAGTDKVAIRTSYGIYVGAHGGGGQGLRATSTTIGEWEHWGYWIRPDGRVALQAANGQWVRIAAEDEGYAVTATKNEAPEDDGAGAYEIFTAEAVADEPGTGTPGAHPNQLHGYLRPTDHGWQDDTGPVNPVGVHAGDLFMAQIEGKDVDTAFDQFQAAGYQFWRFWSPLVWRPENSSFWHNRSASPLSVPDFYDQLRSHIMKGVSRGLKAYPSCGGLSGASNSEERSYYEHLRDIMTEIGPEHFFQPGEVNESRDTGDADDREPREVEALVNILRSAHPNVAYALSAYTGDTTLEQMRAWTPSWMRHWYAHGYRDGHWWDKVRHIVNDGYEYYSQVRRSGCIGEDGGPGKWLSVTANKHEYDDHVMALQGAAAAIARIAYVYICSPGIIFDEPFEGMAGFRSLPAFVRAIPTDVMTYETQHHSGDRFRGVRVFRAQGQTRVDGRLAGDGRFCYVAYGPDITSELTADRGCSIDLVTTTLQTHTFELSAGQRIPSVHVDKGFLLRGRLR